MVQELHWQTSGRTPALALSHQAGLQTSERSCFVSLHAADAVHASALWLSGLMSVNVSAHAWFMFCCFFQRRHFVHICIRFEFLNFCGTEREGEWWQWHQENRAVYDPGSDYAEIPPDRKCSFSPCERNEKKNNKINWVCERVRQRGDRGRQRLVLFGREAIPAPWVTL